MGFKLPSNIDLALTGLAGVGGIFANRAGKSTQTQTTNLSPDQLALLANLNGQYKNINADPDLSGYESGQVSDINHLSNLHMQALQENLALRGITGPAEAAAEDSVDSQRFSDITKLHQSIPLLRNQLQTQNLNTGIGLFGAQPRSTTTTGTTSANKLGGGISNAANVLAYLYGKGAFGNNAPAPNSSPTPKTSSPFNPGVFMPGGYSVNRTPSYVGG